MLAKTVKERTMGTAMMREVFCDTMIAMAQEDPRVYALDADLIGASGMQPFRAKFPDRMIECGIQEANMIGVAAGLAATGKRPYAHSFATFASRRVMDQAFVSSAYAKLPITIVGSDPGVAAAFNGGTHMPFEDMAAMRAIPQTVLVEPCDYVSLRALLPLINDLDQLCYLRLYRKPVPNVYDEGATFTIGKANCLKDGNDVAIIASGIMVSMAMDAAALLEEAGIHAAVIDMHTWKPLDEEMISRYAASAGAFVVAENHNTLCGLGAAVADATSKLCPVPVEKIGVNDSFGEVGEEGYLRQRFHLTADAIAQAAKRAVARKKA